MLFLGTGLGALGCAESPVLEIPKANAGIENPRDIDGWSKWVTNRFLGFNAFIGSNSGYILVLARDGQVIHTTTTGYADVESKRPMQLDTRVRIASMTKPVTAVGAMTLVEEGKLLLDDPVSKYLPEAANLRVAVSHRKDENGEIQTVPLERPITIRDLLTYSSGIGNNVGSTDLEELWQAQDLYSGSGDLEERVNRIFSLPLFSQPGEVWRYGWSSDVLCRVVEVVSGQPLHVFLDERIFTPLGMDATEYRSQVEDPDALATVYMKKAGMGLDRVDVPPREPLTWTPGGGGLVSTAGDYMRFALMLWNGGTYDGVKILSPETVELMTQAHVKSGVLEDMDIQGLGWGFGMSVVEDADATPMIDRNGDFWWAGYYSTTFFVSPETGLVGVVLAQNEPKSRDEQPLAVHIAPAFAFFGL